MRFKAPLQPTLWRTCRALANFRRLRVLHRLALSPWQTVSEVAREMNLTLPVASQALRTLEARGLLTARRVRRTVQYCSKANPSAQIAWRLLPALRSVLRRSSSSVDRVFKLATAFGHPRRIEIFRALARRAQTVEQLRTVTRIPSRSLRRHLKKLRSRGFVKRRLGLYTAKHPQGALGSALARLASR